MADFNQNAQQNAGNMGDQYERQGDHIGAFANGLAQGAGPQGNQGTRVHFQDQLNEPIIGQSEREVQISEQQPLDEEETDIVHELNEAPVSTTLIQGNLVERDNIIPGMESANVPLNPFSESMVARGRLMSATEARKLEAINTSNFNDEDQEMAQYSMENTRPAA